MNKKIIFGIFSFLMAMFFLFTNYFIKTNKLIKNSYQNLEEVSVLKINKIDSYLSIVENEINKLSISDETKILLKQEVSTNKNIVKINVDQKAKIIAQKIENYIKNNPQKTFDELKNDPVFKKITNQTIGLEGFSTVEDFDKQVNYFKENGSFLGEKYKNIENNSPELYKMWSENIGNIEFYGFFDWYEANKKTREIYTYVIKVDTKTADKISLAIVTMAYVDNFKINEETVSLKNDFFNENINKKDFNNLFLINSEGYIIYAKDIDEGAGENINWEDYKDSVLTKKITEIKNENKIVFSDVYRDSLGEFYPEFLALAPVYDQDKLLGYVALAKDLNTIFDIVKDTKNLGKTGESFLVSKNQNLLISPLRQKNFNILIQTINTKSINNCFSEVKNSPDFVYNYNNIETLTFNSLVSKMPWCLSTEINKNEVLEISFDREWLISILFFLFIFFACNLIFSKKNTIFIKKHDLIKLVIKIKIKYIILFSIVLTAAYFFSVTLFFQGWKKAALYNDIPDLLGLSILIILFFYGFKLKNNLAKKLISVGSFLIILDKTIQIILQEYNNTFGLIPLYFWIPGTTIGFIGLFFLFYGFKKEISK